MEKISLSTSVFVISLDFELFWGIRDIKLIDEYRLNLEGVPKVIPEILSLFSEFNIHATWATVGFMFFSDFNELASNLPENRVKYTNYQLSPYPYVLENIRNNDHSFLKLHFAPDLIHLISETPGQEIASHTFSHYYTLEKGQTTEAFESDLIKNLEIARQKNIRITSMVFPRNQVNEDYLTILVKHGITAYRGSQNSWPYLTSNYNTYNNILKKGLRFTDTFLTVFKSDQQPYISNKSLLNIPASRFLQPYANRPSGLERLKITRIKNEMTSASELNGVYHLWWHPHNFGNYIGENLSQLEEILKHFDQLRKAGKMISLSMKNLSDGTIQK